MLYLHQHKELQKILNLYHSWMKLREGIVFSHICLILFTGGSYVTTAYDGIGQSQVTWDPLDMSKLVHLGPLKSLA